MGQLEAPGPPVEGGGGGGGGTVDTGGGAVTGLLVATARRRHQHERPNGSHEWHHRPNSATDHTIPPKWDRLYK